MGQSHDSWTVRKVPQKIRRQRWILINESSLLDDLSYYIFSSIFIKSIKKKNHKKLMKSNVNYLLKGWICMSWPGSSRIFGGFEIFVFFYFYLRLYYLKRTYQVLVYFHHGPKVFKLLTVIRRRKDSHELPFAEKLISLLHNLSY